jgi:hypothetical protein
MPSENTVAEQKHKSPEELGEAVGRKIEELFGGMFADEEPKESQPPVKAEEPAAAARVAPAKPQPVPAPAEAKAPVAQAPKPPQPAPTQPRPQVVKAPAPVQEPKVVSPPKPAEKKAPSAPTAQQQTGSGTFEQIMERIEILILSLEWEVSPESVKEISEKLGMLEPLLPSMGPARTIVAMNLRVLPRFNTPDAVPHRSLLKLLQDSVSALKLIHSSQGKQVPGQTLVSAITNSYKEIMASTVATEAVPVTAPPAPREAQPPFATLVNNVGTAVHSLEEINQRLARILGVLRQGGNMSAEEMTRRLGTLEHLLAERVGQLSLYHKEMAEVRPVAPEGLTEVSPLPGEDRGLLLMNWAGTHLAVHFRLVCAMYRLSEEQAQEFVGAPAIRMGKNLILRLPLKRSAGGRSATLPEWLVHLSPGGQREYFILPDKLLGYRLAPKGVNVATQPRVKIRSISYTVLNQAVLR